MPGADSREHVGGELIAERYQLKSRLGRGAMGEVWSGRDLRLHRDVAVKLFHGGAGMPAGDLPGRLRREGIAAAQIVHPNVAVLYDQGAHRGRIYLIMELVPGTTLADLMQAGRLPVSDALRYAAQVAEALAAAHAARVVHRDIKPQNVLVTPEGTVKVVDFGIAGFLADTHSWTIARFDDTVKGAGTPEYSAPEQILGHNADARSDLYSLGTLLYTMLAGQMPYPASDFLAVMRRKTTEDAPAVPPGAGVPRDVAALVAELLAREPEQRPGSAREVAARLRELLERKSVDGNSRGEEPAASAGERPVVVAVATGPASEEPWTAPPLEEALHEADKEEARPKPVAKLKAQVAPDASDRPAADGPAAARQPAGSPAADQRTSAASASDHQAADSQLTGARAGSDHEAVARAAADSVAAHQPSDHQASDRRAAGTEPAARPPADRPAAGRQPGDPSGRSSADPHAPDPKLADARTASDREAAARRSDQPAAARQPSDRPAAAPKPAAPKPAAPKPAAPKPAAPKPAAPKPADPEPPTWGTSKDHVTPPDPTTWEPLAATGATVLSAVAEVEIRGRSLLPPPARSLLTTPSAARRIPSAAAPITPPPTSPPPPDPPRRALLPILLILLAVVAVGVAAILFTSR